METHRKTRLLHKIVVAVLAAATVAAPTVVLAAPQAAASTLAAPAHRPVLRVGSHGTAVRWVQQRLGIAKTGRFGITMKHRVQRFQRNHHLRATGVVNAATWRALLPAPAPRKAPAKPAPTTTTTTIPKPTATTTSVPSVSPTPTAAPIAAPTAAPTVTVVPPVTPTPIPAPAATPAPVLTANPTPTGIATPTATAGATTSATPAVVPTQSAAPTATATPSLLPPALVPSGQQSAAVSLASSAVTFVTAATGWTSYAGATVSQDLTRGHDGFGALAVTSAGPWTGAMSPRFPAIVGARYSAAGWAQASSASNGVGFSLRFFDASGAVISAGNQVGQSTPDTTAGWTLSPTAVAIAPPGAVTGAVLFLDFDGAAGDLQYVDDVHVTATTGLPTAVAGPLTTSGNQVLDRYGRSVPFHGVDIDGLQYSNTANVTTSEVAAAQLWGANFVRLPLAENYAVPGDCSYDANYLPRVDAMVNAATSAGMFIMLDLHTNAVTACAAPRQQRMPDAQAVTFWQLVSARYKDNPLVGFDLYNEPHDVSDAVWHDGGFVTSSGVTYSAPGMQQLYAAVRGTGATNLIFASGTNWATAFPAAAPLTGTTGLVYGAHAYTCPSGLPTSGATCTTGPDGTIYDPSGLLGNFAAAAAAVPVMVTEFGFPDRYDGRYIRNVQAYAAAHQFIGWDVYAFDNTSTGLFNLWKSATAPVEPSISGMAVIAGMLAD